MQLILSCKVLGISLEQIRTISGGSFDRHF
ncbi:hypothetical protein LHL20_11645 [Alteromonas sp. McT4-15]|nr:hypothetical protein [Alteromonas sp. BZK5]MCB4436881.1 hypothetical protein [Alteromonas sp. McT4-15]MRJ41790.1 hypothetical protein [Idiomarina sp. FeN1]NCU57779.1 hypothetical protein [Idiomarina sp. FenA--70]NCU60331.1 hypothetical protein [Idiomarina sp. FenBw--71]QPL48954.1 hypothetical protein IUA53_13850 [Alteromonas sp. B31-7]UAL44716.1 hypothetical protein K8B83_07840 [Shewanella inventionis]UUN13885.1 hypothetical protein KGF88_01225 [Idiomarina loihiensis]HAU11325.1 hypotheti